MTQNLTGHLIAPLFLLLPGLVSHNPNRAAMTPTQLLLAGSLRTQIDLYCCEHELLVGAVRLLNRFGTVIEAVFNCVTIAEISPTRFGERHPDPDKIVQAESEP